MAFQQGRRNLPFDNIVFLYHFIGGSFTFVSLVHT
jgi:hypothetical protein